MRDPVMDHVFYMSQLDEDIKYLKTHSHTFKHAKRLLQEECDRIRHELYNFDEFAIEPVVLPKGTGDKVHLECKIYFPINCPEYNFIGRLLGPKGETIKQMEKDTRCRIVLRGRGIKNIPRGIGQSRAQDADEDDPHVLVSIKTYENIAFTLLERATEHVIKVMSPTAVDDEFKRRQLIHNAIINGEYRGPRISELTPGDMRAQNMLGNSKLPIDVLSSNIRERQREEYLDIIQTNKIYPVHPHDQQQFKQLKNKAQEPDYQLHYTSPIEDHGQCCQFYRSSPIEIQEPHYQFQHSPVETQEPHYQFQHSPVETQEPYYQFHHSPVETQEPHYQFHHSPVETQEPHYQFHHSPVETQEPHYQFHHSPVETQEPHYQFHHSPVETQEPHYQFQHSPIEAQEPYSYVQPYIPIEALKHVTRYRNSSPPYSSTPILMNEQEPPQFVSSVSAYSYDPSQKQSFYSSQPAINNFHY